MKTVVMTDPKAEARARLRTYTRSAYDLQKLRIQTGLRIVANFKAKLGQEPGESEDELDADAKEILKALRADYKRLTDAYPSFKGLNVGEPIPDGGIISDFAEAVLADEYFGLLKHEERHFDLLRGMLEPFSIWPWLESIKGINSTIATILISEIDIYQTPTVSALWKLCGLDVAPDGHGRSRRKEHLIKRTYIDRKGKEQERDSITFNPFLKTKVLGVIGKSFILSGTRPYRDIFDGYKHRLENHPNHMEKSKGHRNNMAIRYMVKIFLKDLYLEWRTRENLPARPPYAEEKLGIVHSG